MLRWFRTVALAEAVSYLVLLAAAVAKRALDAPGPVEALGPVHGVLFLAYVGLAFAVRPILRWNALTTAIVIVAAVIPFGAFVVERRLPDTEPEAEPAP
jgi:integral membrane protein